MPKLREQVTKKTFEGQTAETEKNRRAKQTDEGRKEYAPRKETNPHVNLHLPSPHQ